MGFFAAFIISIVFLSSCTMLGTRIYNLDLPSIKERPNVGASASVNIILHAPRYLEQPYIAFRVSPYELEMSDDSRWDSSPADILRETMKVSLSSSGFFAVVRTSVFTPPGFYRCEVNLRRFERFEKGNDSFGELDFDITFLSPEGRILYTRSLLKEAKLSDRSFLSLAKFLSEALSQGVDEANTSIVKSLP